MPFIRTTSITTAALTGILLLTVPEARATLLIDAGQCGGTGGGGQCVATTTKVVATAYQISEILPQNTYTGWTNFQSAFTSWNNSLAVGSKWTLVTGNLSA